MAKQNIGIGSTGRSEYIYIADSLSSIGLGKTGISFNTSGLNGHFVRNAGSATTITFSSQTATGAWISGGWAEVDQTRMPGIYRVDLPDVIFSSGSDKAIVYIKGVSNTIPVTLEYQLTASNPNTFTEASIASTVWSNTTRTITGGTITTNNDKNGYTITAGIVTSVSNPVDITSNSMSGIANTVWSNTTRTLSATGISAYDVWNFANRTLSAASGATAFEIWNYANRTLSATGLSAYDVWNYTDRIITGGTGVSITQSFPDNFEFMLITNTGRIYINKADIEKIRA
jgi:hypothetical protein